MSTEKTEWDELAEDLADQVRRDLSGEEYLTPPGHTRTRGPIRTRGSATAASVPRRAITVVVISSAALMPVDEVKKRLPAAPVGVYGEVDLYYVVNDRAENELAPRELNPQDPACGRKHELILNNLKPDYVILPSGQQRPTWCSDTTKLIEMR